MANKQTTVPEPELTHKSVFFGHTDRDIYVAFGRHWGPGVVDDIPIDQALELEKAIKRVNDKRVVEERVDPTALNTPRKVALQDATDEELEEILRQHAAARQPLSVSEDGAVNNGESIPIQLSPSTSTPTPSPPPMI